KERVVAEAPAPARLGQDKPVAGGFDDLRHAARRRDKRHDAAVVRAAAVVGNPSELLEQQRIVLRIPAARRPARRAWPRRPTDRVVELSLTSGTRTTRPPHPSTSVAPTIASAA